MIKFNLKNELQFSYLNKYWLILGLAFLFLGGFFLLTFNFFEKNNWSIHLIFCILSTFFIFFHFFLILKNQNEILIYDLRWIFIISFWLYYVFGSSLLYFGSVEQIDRAMNYYNIDLNLALKVNALNSIGLGTVIILTSIINISWPIRFINFLSKKTYLNDIGNYKLLLILLFLSLFSYILYLGILLGYIELGRFLGFIGFFKEIGLSYFLILVYYKGHGSKFLNLILYIYLAVYIYGGLILLSKSLILKPLLFFCLSIILKRKYFKFMIFSLLLILLLNIFYNYTSSLRTTKNYENKINMSFLKKNSLSELNSDYLWNRFNYINTQGAVINFYDQGNPGESLKNIFWLFVPRFLNENKPIITGYAKDLYERISGHTGSSESPGIFIEGYYNFGLLGLFLNSLLAALIIMIYKSLIFQIIRKKIFHLYFVIFFGILTCFRIDGLMMTDYLGRLIYVLIFIFLLQFIVTLTRIKFTRV